jgi:hypothetical protein
MPEDKARKRAVRARMAETGERYTTAARRLADAPDDRPLRIPRGDTCPYCRSAGLSVERTGAQSVRVTCNGCGECNIRPAAFYEVPPAPGPAYAVLVQADPPAAERDWSTRARVRIITPVGAANVDPRGSRSFTPGEELEMIQWGRAGRSVDRSAWWTSTDIDGAFIIGAEHVEVLEIIKEKAPTFAGAALPAAEVTAMLGPSAAGWAEQGILLVPHIYDLEVRAGSGELLGLIERGGQGQDYDPPRPRQPVTYRAVIREDGSHHPPAVKFPGGFVPPDPARATAAERARWGGTGTGTAAGAQVSTARPVYDPAEPCQDCTCCTAAGCHRGADSECHWSEALGDYTCPCTGG